MTQPCGQVEHNVFNGWTEMTLDEAGCYTELSDMHQVSVMMQDWEATAGKVLVSDAGDLMEKLLSKKLPFTLGFMLTHSDMCLCRAQQSSCL